MIRIWRGERLLARVLKRFDVIIADLAAAAEHLAEQRRKGKEKLELKRTALIVFEDRCLVQDKALATAYERAEAVRQNIAKLISA